MPNHQTVEHQTLMYTTTAHSSNQCHNQSPNHTRHNPLLSYSTVFFDLINLVQSHCLRIFNYLAGINICSSTQIPTNARSNRVKGHQKATRQNIRSMKNNFIYNVTTTSQKQKNPNIITFGNDRINKPTSTPIITPPHQETQTRNEQVFISIQQITGIFFTDQTGINICSSSMIMTVRPIL